MTNTDELRCLLDERGVEWREGEDERKTHWEANGLTWEYFNTENGDAWLGFLGVCESDVSPEQAIAATLGNHPTKSGHGYYIDRDDEGTHIMCDDCGGYIGTAKEIAATLGSGTCRLESMHGYTDPYVTTHYEVELSCHTLDDWPESEPPAYCPWCGAKVVEQ